MTEGTLLTMLRCSLWPGCACEINPISFYVSLWAKTLKKKKSPKKNLHLIVKYYWDRNHCSTSITKHKTDISRYRRGSIMFFVSGANISPGKKKANIRSVALKSSFWHPWVLSEQCEQQIYKSNSYTDKMHMKKDNKKQRTHHTNPAFSDFHTDTCTCTAEHTPKTLEPLTCG